MKSVVNIPVYVVEIFQQGTGKGRLGTVGKLLKMIIGGTRKLGAPICGKATYLCRPNDQ
jgi:hypothetical protein